MPTETPFGENKYFIKIGSNGTATDWQPIVGVPDLACDLTEESIGHLREEVRATNKVHIKKVIFNGPATIVIWMDGTKTIVKCMEGDIYDPEKALMMCVMERLLGGSKMEVKRFFKKWIPEVDLSELGESIGTIASELGESISKMAKNVVKALAENVTDKKKGEKE